MINHRTARLRLLWWQEGTQLFPVLIGERRDPEQSQGSQWVHRHSGSLACAAPHIEALSSSLVLASKVRSAQPSGLLLLRLTHRVE
jgi:hypothetical protein